MRKRDRGATLRCAAVGRRVLGERMKGHARVIAMTGAPKGSAEDAAGGAMPTAGQRRRVSLGRGKGGGFRPVGGGVVS